MKVFLIVLGVLLSLYCAGQFLQFLGLIGTKRAGMVGAAIMLLSGALAALCFQKARQRS